MLIVCLRSRAPWDQQDPLSILVQQFNGWFTPRQDCVDYYINEEYAYMLYLIDSELTRQPSLDYVV